MPRTVTTVSARSDTPRTGAKKAFAASSPSFASFALSTGTTALETAPSPRSWRSAFGIVNATKNASVSPRVKSAASAMSRPRPRTRDASVPAPTMPARPASFRSLALALSRAAHRGTRSRRAARAALGALAERAQILVRVDAARVAVEPDELERVVADGLDLVDLERDAFARAGRT